MHSRECTRTGTRTGTQTGTQTGTRITPRASTLAARTTGRPRATSGESITEVLVAILIGALAGMMLAVAVTTATGITRRSAAFEEHAAISVSQAEQLLASGTTATTPAPQTDTSVTVSFNGASLRPNRTSASANGYVITYQETHTTDNEGYEDLFVFVRTSS